MAGTPLEIAQTRLDLYLAAEAAILGGGQEYTIENRRMRKGDLSEIRSEIRALKAEIATLSTSTSGGSRAWTAYS